MHAYSSHESGVVLDQEQARNHDEGNILLPGDIRERLSKASVDVERWLPETYGKSILVAFRAVLYSMFLEPMDVDW